MRDSATASPHRLGFAIVCMVRAGMATVNANAKRLVVLATFLRIRAVASKLTRGIRKPCKSRLTT